MKQFYVGIKAIIRDGDNVLLLKHAKKGFWDVPGGRIDGDESFHDTLKRELNEELPGIKNPKISQFITASRIPVNLDGDTGLVLLFFDVSAQFPSGITISEEHSEYRWTPLEEAKANVSEGVRAALQELAS
jgi:8-oxo-dGTP diphosphatase